MPFTVIISLMYKGWFFSSFDVLASRIYSERELNQGPSDLQATVKHGNKNL